MPTAHDNLEPIDPRTAQELYLKQKESECAEKTVQAHRYRTNHFVRWCTDSEIGNLNALTGRDLQKYRLWRQEDGDLKQITMNQQMSTIRVFLKWCGSIEAVPANLYEKVLIPRVSPANQRNDETLDSETAKAILDHLRRFHYASIEHALFTLLWETGIRLGAAYSLDVKDVDSEDKQIDLVHRPADGTQLKNGVEGERPIAISSDLATLFHEYIDHVRTASTDEHGREPFFSTNYGRMHRNTIRCAIYRITAPCFRNEPCPGCTDDRGKKCSEAVSPHAIRRGSITHYLSEDIPVEIISDRMNVGRDVIDAHYDKRSEEVKLEQRRGYFE